MKTKIAIVFAFILNVLCATRDNPEDRIPEYRVPSSQRAIQDWLLLGPFTGAADPISEDVLYRSLNIHETALRKQDLEKIASAKLLSDRSGTGNVQTVLSTGVDRINFLNQFHLQYSATPAPMTAYIACVIVADAPRDYYLSVGSDDSLVMWVNGSEVYRNSKRRSYRRGEDSLRISLPQGENFILAKCTNDSGAWCCSVDVYDSDEDLIKASLLEHKNALDSLVFSINSPILLNIKGACGRIPKEYRLRRVMEGKLLDEHSRDKIISRGVDVEGIYRLYIDFSDLHFSQDILVGAPDNIRKGIADQLRALKPDEGLQLYYSQMNQRLDSLLERSPAGRDWHWQRNVCAHLEEMDRMLGNVQRGTIKAGLQFRSFRSAIDGIVQTYRVYIPKSYETGARLPLIVIPPALPERNRPFIVSALNSDQQEFDFLCDAAEKQQVAMLWVGYRNRPYGYPVEFEHFEEVWGDIQMAYDIDEDRVSLLGTCRGGMLAAMMATRFPKRFSGVGLLNPMIHRFRNQPQMASGNIADPVYVNWLNQNDPMQSFSIYNNTPVFVVQSVDEPGHGPLWETRELLELNLRNIHGRQVEFRDQTDVTESFLEIWCNRMIPWLLSQRRERSDSRSVGSSSTVSELLSNRFILVVGRRGDREANSALLRIAEGFQQKWREMFFGECFQKFDDELSGEDLYSTLVLVGGPEYNEVSRSIFENKGPLIQDWHARRHNEKGVSFIAGFPSLGTRGAVLIDSNDYATFPLDRLDLASQGWFRSLIFENSGGGNEVLREN